MKIFLVIAFIVIPIFSFANEDNNYPVVNFIINNNFTGTIYLIHDPSSGVTPEVVDGEKKYLFNSDGVIFVKNYDDVILKNTWIKATNKNGEELYINKSSRSSGPNRLTVITFIVANTVEEMEKFFINKELKSSTEQLLDLGIDIRTK